MINIQQTADELGIGVDDMKMLLDDYFLQAQELAALLKQSIAANDLKNIAIHAHNLKGVSANMGAETIREIAYQIENAGKAGDYALCGAHLETLSRTILEEKVCF